MYLNDGYVYDDEKCQYNNEKFVFINKGYVYDDEKCQYNNEKFVFINKGYMYIEDGCCLMMRTEKQREYRMKNKDR